MIRFLFGAFLLVSAAVPAQSSQIDRAAAHSFERWKAIKLVRTEPAEKPSLKLAQRTSPCADSCNGMAFGGGNSSGGGGYTGPCDVITCISGWDLRAVTVATAGTKAANICNAGDANCADVNSLANGDFDVATSQAAPLNCGGTGGTCTIKTIYDKISTRDITNATAALRPILTFNAIGGKACLTISTNGALQSSATLTSAQPFSFATVFKRTSGTAASYYIASNSNDVGLGAIGANTAVMFNSFGTAGISAAATDNAFHDLIGVFNGSTPNSVLTVDGVDTTGTTSGTVAGTLSMPSDGGADSPAGVQCGGLIATSALNSTQRTNLGNNYKNYYGYR